MSGGVNLATSDVEFIAPNGSGSSSLVPTIVLASPTDPKLKYKLNCSAAQSSSILVAIEDSEDSSSPNFCTVSDNTLADTFFEKSSDPTDNGTYTNEYFIEGHQYLAEMAYKKGSPGDNDTNFK